MLVQEEGARVTILTDIPASLEESWKNDNSIERGGDRATVSPIPRYRDRSGKEGLFEFSTRLDRSDHEIR